MKILEPKAWTVSVSSSSPARWVVLKRWRLDV
jgi:hypothetical protein